MFSLSAEFLALLLIVILAISFHNKGDSSRFSRFYLLCLAAAVLSIVLNCLAVYLLEQKPVPLTLAYIANAAYFAVTIITCGLFSLYMLKHLSNHAYNSVRPNLMKAVIFVPAAMSLVLIAGNRYTGWIFSISAQGQYTRGALNKIGYFIAISYIVIMCVYFAKNKAYIDKNIRRIIYLGIPIAVSLIMFQLAYPNILLNGTIAAYVSIVIFVCFQSRKLEQDSLTVLGNRGSFISYIDEQLRRDRPFEVILVSLCQYSVFNRSYGHVVGDNMLYTVARWLEGAFPRSKIYRFSPVTFAIVSPYTGAGNTEASLNLLGDRFTWPWRTCGISANLSACLTTLCRTDEKWTPMQITEFLEFTLEEAKSSGHSRVAFDKRIFQQLEREKYLVRYLKQAIENHLFEVWYQPIYNCRTRDFSTAEALLRLKDADGSYISPSEFVPIAENNAMIDSISWVVLESVCEFLSATPDLLDSISVNLAMSQLTDPRFPARLSALMDAWGVPHGKIRFEITERVFISDVKLIQDALRDMSARGFGFYLDDFGTGYSNFSNMMRFHFDCIKLDKSLIDDLNIDSKSRLTVASLIELFHNCGVFVVAEGVETEAQALRLQELGADYIQGFYFARPLPQGELRRRLTPEQNVS